MVRVSVPIEKLVAAGMAQHGEPLREIALSFNVDHSTIPRLKARHAAEMI